MASVNKVIIVGNLGGDPETRYTAGGSAVTNISVATTERWTDKQSGEKQEKTEWHRIVFFGRQAEVIGEYMKKGRPLYVEGRLQTDKYTDKDGIERYATKIIGTDFQMLGSNGDNDRQQAGGGQQRPPRQAQAPAPPPPSNEFDDDDIPF